MGFFDKFKGVFGTKPRESAGSGANHYDADGRGARRDGLYDDRRYDDRYVDERYEDERYDDGRYMGGSEYDDHNLEEDRERGASPRGGFRLRGNRGESGSYRNHRPRSRFHEEGITMADCEEQERIAEQERLRAEAMRRIAMTQRDGGRRGLPPEEQTIVGYPQGYSQGHPQNAPYDYPEDDYPYDDYPEEEGENYVDGVDSDEPEWDDLESSDGVFSSVQTEDETPAEGGDKSKKSRGETIALDSFSEFIRSMITGEIVANSYVARFGPHVAVFLFLSFIRITVLFWALHLDETQQELQSREQALHEHSLRMQRQSINATSFSSVERAVERRKLGLARATKPSNNM